MARVCPSGQRTVGGTIQGDAGVNSPSISATAHCAAGHSGVTAGVGAGIDAVPHVVMNAVCAGRSLANGATAGVGKCTIDSKSPCKSTIIIIVIFMP